MYLPDTLEVRGQTEIYLLQLLDLPGIIEGAKDGKGRGRQVIAVARTCVLIFMVLDVLKPLEHKRILEKELDGFGIRLNKTPPNISYKKKDKGGINLTCAVPQSHLDLTSVRSILSEFKVHNADVTLRCDATQDDLIDVVEGNRWVGGGNQVGRWRESGRSMEGNRRVD